MDLDKFIELHTDCINTIAITDNISESYLMEICEQYHEMKLKKLRVADVIKKEVAVCECKDEWLREIRLNVMRCKKCGTEF